MANFAVIRAMQLYQILFAIFALALTATSRMHCTYSSADSSGKIASSICCEFSDKGPPSLNGRPLAGSGGACTGSTAACIH